MCGTGQGTACAGRDVRATCLTRQVRELTLLTLCPPGKREAALLSCREQRQECPRLNSQMWRLCFVLITQHITDQCCLGRWRCRSQLTLDPQGKRERVMMVAREVGESRVTRHAYRLWPDARAYYSALRRNPSIPASSISVDVPVSPATRPSVSARARSLKTSMAFGVSRSSSIAA